MMFTVSDPLSHGVLLTSSWQQFDDLIYYNISPRYSPGYVIILLFLFLEYQRFSLSLHAAAQRVISFASSLVTVSGLNTTGAQSSGFFFCIAFA